MIHYLKEEVRKVITRYLSTIILKLIRSNLKNFFKIDRNQFNLILNLHNKRRPSLKSYVFYKEINITKGKIGSCIKINKIYKLLKNNEISTLIDLWYIVISFFLI
jgi:hypothetical protein